MSASFTIDADAARNLVRVTMSGFFDGESMQSFIVARAAAHERLTCPAGMHLSITDVREMKIQSQDMVLAFQRLLSDPAYRSRRLAFVTAPTLARTQLFRAIGSRVGSGDTRVFDTLEAAEAWLFAPGADDAVAAA